MAGVLGALFSSNQLSNSHVDASVLLSADKGRTESVGRPNASAPSFPLDEHDENYVLCGIIVCGVASTEMPDDEFDHFCSPSSVSPTEL
ncbi:hypothetical protein BLNAU_18186 [Blattamonas nauphoetae]|uniref:Uncharacterized protein n=1 Tax=Blattamonas nauphoetae TaxID=2049346 RepID=A0ABQ9X7D9_9EUKA|nr:hypothetical protein BLNAU_18186 [Blattamonas nauphoetae]